MRLSRTVRSATSPSALRSSEVNAIALRDRRPGARSFNGLPSRNTWPESARSAPNSSRASSVRPEPSSPATPTTSPGCSSRSNGAIAPVRPRFSARSRGVSDGVRRSVRRSTSSSTFRSRPIMARTSSSLPTVGRRVLADHRTVAQHGHPVGDLVDLVEEVRHEQDRDALVAQHPHDPEQLRDLAGVQAGRRLVEDQHPRVDGDRAGDRHQLLHRDRVAAERGRPGRCATRCGTTAPPPAPASPDRRSSRTGAAPGRGGCSPRPRGSCTGSPPGTRC